MYNNNVQTFISDFREICNKLKMMKYNLSDWQKNDRFIDALKAHQQEFVRMKQDKHHNARNKSQITELNLDDLMDQLIAQNNNYKDREKSKKTSKTESDEKNEKKSTNSNFNSKFNNSDSKFNSNVNSNKKLNKRKS